MTFRKFALNNVLRNKRIYAAYFLSSLFTVMVFFTFANFAFHPALTGDEINNKVTLGMLVAGGIIYIFSFFFILYSMSSFLQSRKREFGVLIVQGMSNGQIRRMVFLENMFIGFFATVFGIGIGLLFSKVILLIAENVLVMEESLNFYFPIWALLLTFVSFILLFFFISVFVTIVLRTKRLVLLIKGDKIAKGEPKASILLTLLALLLIGVGYYFALTTEGSEVFIALVPVVLLVITGSYFLFTQLSVFLINRLKSRKRLFWKKTNMLLLSDLSHRMKDNARSFFMVAVISTVAFSAIGTLVGLNSYLTEGIRSVNPFSFDYFMTDDRDELEQINETFKKYNLKTKGANIELTRFEQDGQSVVITTPKQYNTYAELIGEAKIELHGDQFTIVEKSTKNMMPSEIDLFNKPLVLSDGTEIPIENQNLGIAKADVLPPIDEYYIVSEELFSKLGEPTEVNKYFAWQVISGKKEDIIEAGRELTAEFLGFMAIDFLIHDIQSFWSPIMLVGLFIGIVFFVSAGSFLYFRLYTDLDEDKEKFTAISKIGLTLQEMKKVIGRQITILFFLPIGLALIHGAVALTALSNMFDYNLVLESTIVLGSFLLIQIIYYFLVRFLYTRQVKRAVY